VIQDAKNIKDSTVQIAKFRRKFLTGQKILHHVSIYAHEIFIKISNRLRHRFPFDLPHDTQLSKS